MRRKSRIDTELLEAIEGLLAGTLKPVTPPTDFVQQLRGHIHLPEREELVVRFHDWQQLMLVFGGVLSGAVVILTLARALYHLLGRRS